MIKRTFSALVARRVPVAWEEALGRAAIADMAPPDRRITNPRGGFINLEGQWDVENKGVAPDIEVEITPKDAAQGRDPQLERGVQEALRLLEANPVKIVTHEPPAPVRVKRPGAVGASGGR